MKEEKENEKWKEKEIRWNVIKQEEKNENENGKEKETT